MKIEFLGQCPVPHETLVSNLRHARAMGLPEVRDCETHGRRLAVVGGAPSIARHLDEIREYSDIWAINGACRFLREHGIDSTLLSVDPTDILAPRVEGATKALLATRCHPATFQALEGADIEVFDLEADGEDGLWCSSSTVSVVFALATKLGFRGTDFFGCEGSFETSTHAYMDESELQDHRLLVECGGKHYLTAPDLYIVTTQMATLLRHAVNESFTERSGGLLRALIEHPEHDIVKASPLLVASLKPQPCKSCGQTVGHYDDCEVGLGVTEAN